jgi:hypothetical protein
VTGPISGNYRPNGTVFVQQTDPFGHQSVSALLGKRELVRHVQQVLVATAVEIGLHAHAAHFQPATLIDPSDCSSSYLAYFACLCSSSIASLEMELGKRWDSFQNGCPKAVALSATNSGHPRMKQNFKVSKQSCATADGITFGLS